MIRAAALALLVALPLGMVPALAVQPDEVLADPALEARARSISRDLRCLVCRNESIDESHAPLARDLRLLVRERLMAGDSDAEVIRYIVDGGEGFAGYGEYVLLRPQAGGGNLILWLAGPAMLVAGLGGAALYVAARRRAPEPAARPLDPDEAKRLAEILKD
jgi:cytochrome c-type biogenesis protein CcmH